MHLPPPLPFASPHHSEGGGRPYNFQIDIAGFRARAFALPALLQGNTHHVVVLIKGVQLYGGG